MSDDSPFPPDKRGTNPRSLANLKPRRKGDPSPNKTGFNGRTRAERVAAFLEEVDDTPIGKSLMAKVGCPGVSRIEAVLHREWLAAMGKSDLARKGLREAYAGKPRQAVDLESPDGSMSPLGPDSVAAALRTAIEEKRRAQGAAAAPPTPQEKPADDPAGGK